MVAFEVEELAEGFKAVLVSSDKTFTSEQINAVDTIWGHAIKEYPQLFNGQFFNFENFSSQKLFGRFLEYKYFYASAMDKDLRKELQIVPVGITGVTQFQGKKLIGRRSKSVTLYKGMYEFVPAGSLDAQGLVNGEVDIEKQFVSELEEEAGVPSECIMSIKPFLFVRDNTDDLVEIFATIDLNENGLRSTLQESNEYTELHWLDNDALLQHFSQHYKKYVPIMKHLLTTF